MPLEIEMETPDTIDSTENKDNLKDEQTLFAHRPILGKIDLSKSLLTIKDIGNSVQELKERRYIPLKILFLYFTPVILLFMGNIMGWLAHNNIKQSSCMKIMNLLKIKL